jgi:hypothetical protein
VAENQLNVVISAEAKGLNLSPNYGILFGGYLLSKENFITIFKQFYQQKKEQLKKILQDDIVKYATKYTIKQGQELYRMSGQNAQQIYQT